jgi:copper(I)-binding protein
MHPRSRLVLLAAAMVLAACSGGAVPSVRDAWVRAAAADGVSAAYLTITALSGAPDALVSATSPAAEMVMIHETSTDDAGQTGMDEMVRCDIPAGGSVEFRPGGRHLMLTGLTGALTPGSTIELDLVFEHAGVVAVRAEIRHG